MRLKDMGGERLRVVLAGLAAGAALMPSMIFAHHSPAVFDRTREIVVEGLVTDFRWGQPHSWIHMDVENESGVKESWTFEMNPAQPHLRRAGWNARTLEPGDPVTVTAHPLRNGEHGGQFISIRLADGTVMDGG